MGKRKGGTESETRKHKFFSFREKVDSIKIDPVRKTRKKVTDYDNQESYTVTALQNWSELNLSAVFGEFQDKVGDYRSLALVVLYKDKIIDALFEGIAQKDKNSMESLTDLVTQLARDLGPDYEDYFERTLNLLTKVLAELGQDNKLSQPDYTSMVQSIFNCMAYLFKYLSRLLTENLVPTYNAITPLMGKTNRQRDYITRFAAESLSFLIRKCNGDALLRILEAIIADAEAASDTFYNALVILMADSMISSGTHLHSRTPGILNAMLVSSESSRAADFSAAVLERLLHHARADTASVVYQQAHAYITSSDHRKLVGMKIMFVLAGLRKGSRVSDWDAVYKHSLQTFTNEETVPLVELASVLIVCGEFSTTTKHIRELFSALLPLISWSEFLAFAALVLEGNKDTFTNFVAPVLKENLNKCWTDDEEGVFMILSAMHSQGVLSTNYTPGATQLSSETKIVEQLSNYLSVTARNLEKREKQLEVWYSLELFRIAFKPSASVSSKTEPLLNNLLKVADTSPINKALIGKLLNIYTGNKLEMFKKVVECESFPSLARSKLFLKGFLEFVKSMSDTLENIDDVLSKFNDCFSSSDRDIRYTAGEIVQQIRRLGGLDKSKLISQCMLIDDIPLDITNGRNLTMHIRNLGVQFQTEDPQSVTSTMVVNFLFGLLTVRFQPVWQAALEVFSKVGDQHGDKIWDRTYQWLEHGKNTDTESLDLIELDEGSFEARSFQCTHLLSHDSTAVTKMNQYADSGKSLTKHVGESVKSAEDPPFLRNQALQVLKKAPRMAERFGRYLVPFLLHDEDDDEDEGTAGWSFKDRLELLELFALFGNPKSLYETEKVYVRYLYLLGNRSPQVQKVALKCILTFKDAKVRKYADSLNNLLDETSFKDEITNLINNSTEDGEGTLHPDDRDSVLPLVIRVLFGKSQIAKSGGGVQQGWRGAAVSSLNNVEPEYIKLFLSLATDRLNCEGFLVESDGVYNVNTKHESLQDLELLRRELGFVTMLERVVDLLRAKVAVGIDIIMEALLFSLYHAKVAEETSEEGLVLKTSKSIRTVATKCLDLLFELVKGVDWAPYFGIVYDHVVVPRLDNFGAQNLGQPSALMRMFQTLSTTNELVEYFAWNEHAIPRALLDTLRYDSVVDSVVELCVTTTLNVLQLDQVDDLISTMAPLVLAPMPVLFARDSSNELLNKEAQVLVELLERAVITPELRNQLIAVAINALEKTTAKIRVDVKVTIMRALSGLLVHEDTSEEQIHDVFKSMAVLFKQFVDRSARIQLSLLYQSFGRRVAFLKTVGDLIVELNAYSKRRMDMLDFDRRLAAYAKINKEQYAIFSAEEWRPVIYNMLFFIKDKEELALRTNSSYSIQRFIDCFSEKSNDEQAAPYIVLLQDVLLPAVRIGIREQNYLFRQEFISILAYIVEKAKYYTAMDDMKVLLFDGDEEANFFLNVAHIQQHRRQRAIRRLSEFARAQKLRDTSIAHYLLPIIEHYVEDDGDSHNLSTETISTIGVLTRNLTWNQYRAITKRYVSYLVSRPDSLKISIRLIDTVADSLAGTGAEDSGEEMQTVEDDGSPNYGVMLRDDLPKIDRLSVFITEDIVPLMQKALKTKKEDEDDLTTRIPLAIPIVKFMKVLPQELLEKKLPGTLTGFCQILRAKSQPLRDMIRKSLGKIARILGAHYLVFIIRELRGALRRGTQLHVLGYSVHSLLTEMKDVLQHGDLDEASAMISDIIMEDTFGVTAAEKDAEEYTSKMKEVKQHKSFDTGEILARNVHLSSFVNIIEPVKTILLFEKMTLTIERKVEELMRRVAEGLKHNAEAKDRSVLAMCHELQRMCEMVEEKELKKREGTKNLTAKEVQKKEQEQHFTVTLDSRNWHQKNTVHVQNLFIIIKFTLDALNNVMSRQRELLTVENVMAFLPLIETSLLSNYESVQISALRLLLLLLRIELPNGTEKLKMYGRQTLQIIKSCPSTNTELCQAALKFMAALVEVKDFDMKDSAYMFLLQHLQPDLEEPSRQGITFTFIKAVLKRGKKLPQVYDIMDDISRIMVQSHGKDTREKCRSLYFQFLTEYPQGENRLSKQFRYLAENLNHASIEGQLSLMEMIHLLLTKVDNKEMREAYILFFASLVMMLANDLEKDLNSQVRVHANQLLTEIWTLSKGTSQQQTLEKFCQAWIVDVSQPALLLEAMHVIGIYMTSVSKHDETLVQQTEKTILDTLDAARVDSDTVVTIDQVYAGLLLWEKYVETFPARAFTKKYQNLWSLVHEALLFPEVNQVRPRHVASRLMGRLYKQYDEAQTDAKTTCEIDIEPLQSVAFRAVRQLGAVNIDSELGIQIVKNLVFITRQFEKNKTLYINPRAEDAEAEEEGTSATMWLVRKLSSVLRDEKEAVHKKVSKQSCIQYLASVIHLVPVERLEGELSYELIVALYPYSVSEDERFREYKDLCNDVLKMLQTKMGTTEFLAVYAKVRQMVADRRIERRAKRSIQAVNNPELHAKKKIKKNLHKREQRRHVKDANGFYHTKKKF